MKPKQIPDLKLARAAEKLLRSAQEDARVAVKWLEKALGVKSTQRSQQK